MPRFNALREYFYINRKRSSDNQISTISAICRSIAMSTPQVYPDYISFSDDQPCSVVSRGYYSTFDEEAEPGLTRVDSLDTSRTSTTDDPPSPMSLSSSVNEEISEFQASPSLDCCFWPFPESSDLEGEKLPLLSSNKPVRIYLEEQPQTVI